MKEIWKNIKGYEDYFISNFGKVKRIRNGRDVYYKSFPNKYRYNYIHTGIWKNKKKHTKAIHRLVAETFIPRKKNKTDVNHIDGDKNNNKVDNLEWCNQSENTIHAYRLGLIKKGEKASNAKLTLKEVKEIRRKYTEKDNFNEIGRKYNISGNNINLIIKNKIWID